MYESLNHAELATCVLVMAIVSFIFLINFVAIYSSIYKLKKRLNTHAKSLVVESNSRKANIESCEKYIAEIENSIFIIKQKLYEPLYEVGNTIWYNNGANGEPGIHLDTKAKIISIPSACGEPLYEVQHQDGTTETIYQSLITAWTN